MPDVGFLEALAGQVGAAIGRADLFAHVTALAYSDPPTPRRCSTHWTGRPRTSGWTGSRRRSTV